WNFIVIGFLVKDCFIVFPVAISAFFSRKKFGVSLFSLEHLPIPKLLGNFVDEPTWPIEFQLPKKHSTLGEGDIEAFHCSSHGYVKKTSLFFNASLSVLQAPKRREYV